MKSYHKRQCICWKSGGGIEGDSHWEYFSFNLFADKTTWKGGKSKKKIDMEDHHHHHPAAGSALRVRLVFNEADFDLGELQRTWLLVPPSAKRVSDLGRLICDKFNLKPEEWEQGE